MFILRDYFLKRSLVILKRYIFKLMFVYKDMDRFYLQGEFFVIEVIELGFFFRVYFFMFFYGVVIFEQFVVYIIFEFFFWVRRCDVSLEFRVFIESCRIEAIRKRVMYVVFGFEMYVEFEQRVGSERVVLIFVVVYNFVAIVVDDVVGVYQTRVERVVFYVDVADFIFFQDVVGY